MANDYYYNRSFDVNLKLLTYTHQHPIISSHRKQVVILAVQIISTLIFFTLAIVNLKYHMSNNSDLLQVSDDLFSITMFWTILNKSVIVAFNRRQLADLVTDRRHFLPTPDSLLASTHGIYYIGYMITRLLQSIIVGLAIMIGCKPWLLHELPLNLYLPNGTLAFETFTLSQYIYIMLNIPTVVGLDCLYINFSFSIRVQFLILNERIATLGRIQDSAVKKHELRECIDQHRFLLSYLVKFERIFLSSLFIEYFTVIGLMCSCAYIVTNNSSVSAQLIQALFVLASYIRFGMYCLPATAISSAMEDMSNAYYECGWEPSSIDYQKQVAVCLMRSQRPYELKALGLIPINNITYLKVMKIAFSTYALLNSINN